eukprot:8880445-Alexandrium_andersonii.AAC.1
MLWHVLSRGTALLDRLCYATGAFHVGDTDPWRAGAVRGDEGGACGGDSQRLVHALNVFGAPAAFGPDRGATAPTVGVRWATPP